RPCRQHEEELASGRYADAVLIEHQRADSLAEGRRAGLPRNHHIDAEAAEVVREQGRLGAFPGALNSFKRKEKAVYEALRSCLSRPLADIRRAQASAVPAGSGTRGRTK